MTVIFRYLEQFHIEDISLAIFSKLVSLVLLLVFLLFSNASVTTFLRRLSLNHFPILDKVRRDKKPYPS